MKPEWIVAVIDDLRTFAEINELTLLASQLEMAKVVAEVEASVLKNELPSYRCGNHEQSVN